MMKLIEEYNAYIDARVARLAKEDAVDEKSGSGGEEEEYEERPSVVFKPPAKKPRKPTATATTKRSTKKAPLKQIESVASSSTATNAPQETLEITLDSDEYDGYMRLYNFEVGWWPIHIFSILIQILPKMNLWRRTVFFRANVFELAKVSWKFERKVIELKQDRAKINENKSSIWWSQSVAIRSPEMQKSWVSIWFQSWKSNKRLNGCENETGRKIQQFKTLSNFALETRQH